MSKVTRSQWFRKSLSKTYRVNDEILITTKYSVSVHDINLEYLMKFKYFDNVYFYLVFPVLFIFLRKKSCFVRSVGPPHKVPKTNEANFSLT